MKTIQILFVILLFSGTLNAQDVTGTWYGSLNVQGTTLSLIYHITKSGDVYSSTMDSPDQKAMGLPMDQTTFINALLTVESNKFGLKYSGTFLPDSNKINGKFYQGVMIIPMVLSREKIAVKPSIARPQDPNDFPYKQEEVTFNNLKAGNKLSGTLTIPSNGKASKIVVLISGSGPQNRNEEIVQFNHRPFLVWSDWLSRQGIAVLRYDDRGIGQSTGNFNTATTADFADDAEAAVDYIKSRADLKNLSIGLVGHSEGGMIAPMIASRNPAVKFIVLLAGPGVPIIDLATQQATDQMKINAAPAAIIERSAATNRRFFTAMIKNQLLPMAQFKTVMDTLISQELRTYPDSALGGIKVADLVKRSSVQINTPWFRYFITFNPANYLIKVKCPVLALNGTLDTQVQCSSNLAAIKRSLEKGGNKHFEIVPLTGLNHLFQKANTGAIKEYAEINETINPIALQKVSSWIAAL